MGRVVNRFHPKLIYNLQYLWEVQNYLLFILLCTQTDKSPPPKHGEGMGNRISVFIMEFEPSGQRRFTITNFRMNMINL